MEKEMTTCCSMLAWEIPWTGEPGGLHSVGSQKSPVIHNSPQTGNSVYQMACQSVRCCISIA